MGYTALYRQWRPQGFNEVLGQEHVTRTLKNALAAGRIGHAYLFSGPRGTGKTSMAKVLAKAVNCENPASGEPCLACVQCQRIATGTSLDVLEIDAASNRGIDEIRDLREKVKFAPAGGKYRVYIVDEVHMLTSEAFNALLKTLEEPPAHAIFVLATTEPQKLPLTVLSRCQRFDFRRIDTTEMIARLQEVVFACNTQADGEAISLIARFAGGSMRDALSLLDQCLVYAEGGINLPDVIAVLGIIDADQLLAIAEGVAAGDREAVLNHLDQAVNAGKDLRRIAGNLAALYRDLLLLQLSQDEALLNLPADNIAKAGAVAGCYTPSRLIAIIDSLCAVEAEMKWSTFPRILLEIVLLKAIDSPGDRLEKLERRLVELEASMSDRHQPALRDKPVPLPAVKPVVPAAGKPANPVKPERPARPETSSQAPQTPEVGLDGDLLRQRWNQVLELVRKAKITAYAFLVEAEADGMEGSTVVISFPQGHHFHKERMELAENRKVLEEACRKVFGAGARMRYAMADKPLKTAGEDQKAADQKVDELVTMALEVFGGDLVEVKE